MLSRIFLAGVIMTVLPQGAPPQKPQVFYSRELKREIAVYVPSDQIVRFSKTAPPTLRICIQDVCKTQAAWLAAK